MKFCIRKTTPFSVIACTSTHWQFDRALSGTYTQKDANWIIYIKLSGISFNIVSVCLYVLFHEICTHRAHFVHLVSFAGNRYICNIFVHFAQNHHFHMYSIRNVARTDSLHLNDTHSFCHCSLCSALFCLSFWCAQLLSLFYFVHLFSLRTSALIEPNIMLILIKFEYEKEKCNKNTHTNTNFYKKNMGLNYSLSFASSWWIWSVHRPFSTLHIFACYLLRKHCLNLFTIELHTQIVIFYSQF